MFFKQEGVRIEKWYNKKDMKRNLVQEGIALVVSLSLPFIAGGIGSMFTISSVSRWYVFLDKPVFAPPSWIFGPVWTVLYLLMGIAAFLVWRSKSKYRNRALTLYGSQLVLNALWSVIFFGLRSPGWALIEIAFLWALIILTLRYFFRADRIAGYLFVPYLLWVSFALVLNEAIYRLNG